MIEHASVIACHTADIFFFCSETVTNLLRSNCYLFNIHYNLIHVIIIFTYFKYSYRSMSYLYVVRFTMHALFGLLALAYGKAFAGSDS